MYLVKRHADIAEGQGLEYKVHSIKLIVTDHSKSQLPCCLPDCPLQHSQLTTYYIYIYINIQTDPLRIYTFVLGISCKIYVNIYLYTQSLLSIISSTLYASFLLKCMSFYCRLKSFKYICHHLPSNNVLCYSRTKVGCKGTSKKHLCIYTWFFIFFFFYKSLV